MRYPQLCGSSAAWSLLPSTDCQSPKTIDGNDCRASLSLSHLGLLMLRDVRFEELRTCRFRVVSDDVIQSPPEVLSFFHPATQDVYRKLHVSSASLPLG